MKQNQTPKRHFSAKDTQILHEKFGSKPEFREFFTNLKSYENKKNMRILNKLWSQL